MEKNRIIELYELLVANKATLEERAEFERLLHKEDAELALKEYWARHWDGITRSDEDQARIENYESIFKHIVTHPQKHRVRKITWPKYAIAASILLMLSVGGYFLWHKNETVPSVTIAKNDIDPGNNRATLTLANGKKIVLTKGLKGLIATQGTTNIQAGADDISYQAAANEEKVSYNTLATARGEQSPFPLVLADGSKVWLNAQSTITFPTAFNGKERLVKITGEAYFEVVHNDTQPFKVEFNGQTVQDIGTHFNINAYQDEPLIRTTVSEGSVSVTKGNSSAIVHPGQQAISQTNTNLIDVKNADLDGTMAWRNGFSHFDHADIPTIMRTLGRWYNVEVVYDGAIPKREFSGDIPRGFKASQALNVLALLKIDFRIEGQRIIVTNKKSINN